ncbi:MAG: UDP-N-acetylmuramoyl-L-alanine--D-glutamate ligase, partial [Gammaproteobacteria bacterium]|nr:UDP-N-acetylmuramoyl-L-alanine--D-glutamate ligase [Gammaproteobacteria bacterium]
MSAQYKKQHMQKKLVFGLGQTGLSCVRFLVRQGYEVAVFDTRPKPPLVEQLYREFPHVEVTLQNVTDALFDDVDQVILSPGISLKSQALAIANERKIEIIGDIELFALSAKAPVIAITGSNGKTTTTTLISEIFKAAGYKIEVGGNIGTPVLELLDNPVPNFYILELSSFQLETTRHLKPAVAVVLNISADHMDRYEDLNAYADAKFSIFDDASKKVINLDDQWLKDKLFDVDDYIGFTENEPADNAYGLLKSGQDNKLWIAIGSRNICDAAILKLQGRHQLMNAVAAVAVADTCKIDEKIICKILAEFDGLEHRTQFVAIIDNVTYINDSKGTNVGATVAAINGFDSKIILLAGGDGKGADFSELADVVKNKVRCAILFGHDAGLIEKVIEDSTSVIRAVSL